MSSTRQAALALAVAALAIGGCGSSKTGTSGTGTNATATSTTPSSPPVSLTIASGKPLTHTQWMQRAEAICTRLNEQLATTTVRTQQDFARMLPQASAYERVEVAALARLVPPASKQKDWREFLTATAMWAENSGKLGEAAKTSRTSILVLPLAQSTKTLHEHLAAIARHDGFKECALV